MEVIILEQGTILFNIIILFLSTTWSFIISRGLQGRLERFLLVVKPSSQTNLFKRNNFFS